MVEKESKKERDRESKPWLLTMLFFIFIKEIKLSYKHASLVMRLLDLDEHFQDTMRPGENQNLLEAAPDAGHKDGVQSIIGDREAH